jgi:predicted site-specific integrase-resolvase
MKPPKQVLKASEVARMLGINAETVRRFAVAGRIPAFKLHPTGNWLFAVADIDNILARRQISSHPSRVGAVTRS